MEIKMQEITKQTLQEIERRFKTEEGYVGHFNGDNTIYCPQVNGLVNICLKELNKSAEAQDNSQRFLDSFSFNREKGLFYREVDTTGRIVAPYFNTCKNAVFALSLASNGLINKAENILRNMKESPLYIKDRGLYAREYNPETGEVNPLIITQSNLWVALAYSAIGQNDEARSIMRSLENKRYSQDCGLFNSQDCRLFNSQDCGSQRSKERFFVDDQALAIQIYCKIGEMQKARDLTEAVLNSLLYDRQTCLFNSSFSNSDVDQTKSTYKNSLMAQALNGIGYTKELKKLQAGLVRELYDSEERLFNQKTNDRTKVPDNSALALVALELK